MSFLAGGLPDGKDYSLVVLPAPDLQGPSCWKSAECNFRRIAGLSHAWGWWASDGCRILRGVMHRSREKAMATHSSTLAWKIPWTEEPGRLPSMGSLRVGHDWSDLAAAAAAAAEYFLKFFPKRSHWVKPLTVLPVTKILSPKTDTVDNTTSNVLWGS